jgi:hypothetical protein
MKIPLRTLALAAVAAFATTSCTTTYDAYGRPVQSVDPALAVAGIAAAGLVGYALANDNDNDYRHYRRGNYYRGNYYRGNSYRGHYRGSPAYCAPRYHY